MRNGEQYTGEWRGEKRNGRGRYIYQNGDMYEGDWRNDKRSGKGTLTFKNGRIYRGEFLDDKPNGQGAYSIGNTVYETITEKGGQFINGKLYGYGTIRFENGDVY